MKKKILFVLCKVEGGLEERERERGEKMVRDKSRRGGSVGN